MACFSFTFFEIRSGTQYIQIQQNAPYLSQFLCVNSQGLGQSIFHQLRARRALSIYAKMFQWEPEGHYRCTMSMPLVLNGTSLNSDSVLLALNWWFVCNSCIQYTLLKSNVTTWSVGGRCRGSQECGSRNVNFVCKFHWRWHAVFGSSHNSEIYNIGARAQ